MSNKKHHQKRRHDNSRPQPNNDMRDKMAGIVNSGLVVRSSIGTRQIFKSIDSWKGDGEDHICIDFHARTELGKMLDFSCRLPLNHNLFMDFMTISGFWSYVRSRDRPEELRTFVGKDLKLLGQKLEQRPVRHLKAIVMDAAYQRIMQNAKLKKLMYENELPFDVYRMHETGVGKRSPHHDWISSGYSEIQRAIQSNQEPNFSFLTDTPDNPPEDIYESIRPKIPDHVRERFEKKAKPNPPKKEHKSQKNQPKPVEAKKKVAVTEEPKPRIEAYTFKKDGGYTLLVPVCNAETEDLFLPAFRKTVKINNVEIQTGPVLADISMPVVRLSDHPQLAASGLQTEHDVIRPGPIVDRSFDVDFETKNVIHLNTLIIKEKDERYVSIPAWLRLVNADIDVAGNKQTVVESNGRLEIVRDVLLFKQIDQILTENGETPAFVKDALALVANHKTPEAFTYIVMQLVFNMQINYDEREVYLNAAIVIKGVSTNSHDVRVKEVVSYDEQSDLPSFHVEGYTTSLYRGKLRTETGASGEGTKVDVVSPEPTVEIEESPMNQVRAELAEASERQALVESDLVDEPVPSHEPAPEYEH